MPRRLKRRGARDVPLVLGWRRAGGLGGEGEEEQAGGDESEL